MQTNIFKTTKKRKSNLEIVPILRGNRKLNHYAEVSLISVFIMRAKNEIGRADGFTKVLWVI